MSSNRIFVNNLPWSVTADKLREIFSAAGKVADAEIFSHNNRSKGCGIVSFETAEGASKALANFQEHEIEGRPMRIREDREGNERPPREERERAPRPPRTQNATSNGNGNTRPDDNGRKIFVSNLAYRVSWQDLKDAFAECGSIIRADVARSADNRSRGFGTVVFNDEAGAQKAIQTMDGYELQGRQIAVRLDRFTQ